MMLLQKHKRGIVYRIRELEGSVRGILTDQGLTILLSYQKKRTHMNAPFKMPNIKRPTFPKKTFNITDYGAVGDGKTINTKAFAKAIRALPLFPRALILVGSFDRILEKH